MVAGAAQWRFRAERRSFVRAVCPECDVSLRRSLPPHEDSFAFLSLRFGLYACLQRRPPA